MESFNPANNTLASGGAGKLGASRGNFFAMRQEQMTKDSGGKEIVQEPVSVNERPVVTVDATSSPVFSPLISASSRFDLPSTSGLKQDTVPGFGNKASSGSTSFNWYEKPQAEKSTLLDIHETPDQNMPEAERGVEAEKATGEGDVPPDNLSKDVQALVPHVADTDPTLDSVTAGWVRTKSQEGVANEIDTPSSIPVETTLDTVTRGGVHKNVIKSSPVQDPEEGDVAVEVKKPAHDPLAARFIEDAKRAVIVGMASPERKEEGVQGPEGEPRSLPDTTVDNLDGKARRGERIGGDDGYGQETLRGIEERLQNRQRQARESLVSRGVFGVGRFLEKFNEKMEGAGWFKRVAIGVGLAGFSVATGWALPTLIFSALPVASKAYADLLKKLNNDPRSNPDQDKNRAHALRRAMWVALLTAGGSYGISFGISKAAGLIMGSFGSESVIAPAPESAGNGGSGSNTTTPGGDAGASSSGLNTPPDSSASGSAVTDPPAVQEPPHAEQVVERASASSSSASPVSAPQPHPDYAEIARREAERVAAIVRNAAHMN